MNNQSELTLDDLRSLLENNEIKNFDPVAEAFRVYDPPTRDMLILVSYAVSLKAWFRNDYVSCCNSHCSLSAESLTFFSFFHLFFSQ